MQRWRIFSLLLLSLSEHAHVSSLKYLTYREVMLQKWMTNLSVFVNVLSALARSRCLQYNSLSVWNIIIKLCRWVYPVENKFLSGEASSHSEHFWFCIINLKPYRMNMPYLLSLMKYTYTH